MQYKQNVISATLDNKLHVFFFENLDFELGMVIAVVEDKMFQYVLPQDAKGASDFYFGLVNVLHSIMNNNNIEKAKKVIQALMDLTDDDTRNSLGGYVHDMIEMNKEAMRDE